MVNSNSIPGFERLDRSSPDRFFTVLSVLGRGSGRSFRFLYRDPISNEFCQALALGDGSKVQIGDSVSFFDLVESPQPATAAQIRSYESWLAYQSESASVPLRSSPVSVLEFDLASQSSSEFESDSLVGGTSDDLD